ncbi:hypothetical protein LEM8419_00299 [Neolewinella maritima]|uniref:DUF58 domain-containing protein n=1 Tax=Neolewinella maritima TaxID=1383882 RepID=A0ABN8EYV7_9BACT|nr:DUF58 domain-containing protein [Neolewinella maritima]CAH0999006.1 hypothetical protein LEM8419_00299 [Neolewinella maritima]
MNHLSALYLGSRFFLGLAVVSTLSAIGFWYPGAFWLSTVLLGVLLLLVVYDTYLLHSAAKSLTATRQPPPVFSLGDEMQVHLSLHNAGSHDLWLTLIDELPEQLQRRDHHISVSIAAGAMLTTSYGLRPTQRGVHSFGALQLFLRSALGLVERRVAVPLAQSVAVYPSIVQMKQFAARGHETVRTGGRRRPRPVAKSYEFDQIKDYVRGDDLRSVNWKASARRGELMVNTYVVERAQRIYCVIDKSRSMLMPFAGLSLLDYAINASLAVSNVVLRRDDRAGLITFSDKLGDVLTADSKPDQLRRILETLYRQQEREGESDYDLLYYATRRFLPARSMLLLFTNFESNNALDRVLPVLRRIGRNHALVVILFQNTEITELLEPPAASIEEVYRKSTARRYVQERELMAARLRQNGIQVVLTRPEDLTGATISKYLELKGRGSI